MKTKVSAPGKLMLLGDHAVVYGHPCIVTAVDKRLYVEAEKIDAPTDDIITPQVKESRFVLETLSYFKEKFHIDDSVRIRTNGDFSHRVGLGSSSAVTVATFQALGNIFGIPLSRQLLFDMSYKVTLLIQGVGSGFDIAAAVFGKTIYYVTGGKEIEAVPVESLPLVVGYSGIKADTPFYIRKVAEEFKKKREALDKIFSSIDNLVAQAREGLRQGDLASVGTCLTANHMLLQQMGVSTQKLDDMVQASINAGAWGAKLSGAGGGDCMIALIPDGKRLAVEKAIEAAGGEIIHVAVNTAGVIIENQ